MGEFTTGIQQRIRQAEAALRDAAESGDDFATGVAQGDLENLYRLASEHGVALPTGEDLRDLAASA